MSTALGTDIRIPQTEQTGKTKSLITLYYTLMKSIYQSKSILSSNLAASDIIEGAQGGSHTTSTVTECKFNCCLTFCSISTGKDTATGHPGVVKVIFMKTELFPIISTSYTNPSS